MKSARIFIAILLTVIMAVATALPALADTTVPTSGTVGANGIPPTVMMIAMTPDQLGGDAVQVFPEPAQPNASGTFTGALPAGSDGWQQVNFYVMLKHQNLQPSAIDYLSIDMNYPSAAVLNAATPAYTEFLDRAGLMKFEIDLGATNGTWAVTGTVYRYADPYPDGTVPTPPASHVRQIVSGTTTDWVDINANGQNDDATNGQTFLATWGNNIKWFDSWQSEAYTDWQGNQAILLEVTGWMWFHQPGVQYPVSVIAGVGLAQTAPQYYSGSGTSNNPTAESKFHYQTQVGMYLDFNTVNFGAITPGLSSWNTGDSDLSTFNKSTIWNNGNQGAQVTVSSTPMLLNGDQVNAGDVNKRITNFDATLYYKSPNGTIIQTGAITYLAGTGAHIINVGNSETGNPVLLQACRPAKIEFSVDPPAGQNLHIGSYSGTLTIGVAPYTGTQQVVLVP